MNGAHSSCLAGDTPFTTTAVTAVSAATLAPFDTLVLVQVCNPRTQFTAQQLTDINNFISGGKKLIIWDADFCAPSVDYSWFAAPFTTNNPGAAGATGTLTIAEDDTLASSNPSSPYFINAGIVGSQTD